MYSGTLKRILLPYKIIKVSFVFPHLPPDKRAQKCIEMCPPASQWARWGSKSCPRHRKSRGREQKPTEMCPPAPKWARWGSKLCPRHRKSSGREQKPTEMYPPADKLPCGLRFLPLGCYELNYKHYGKTKQHEANTLP